MGECAMFRRGLPTLDVMAGLVPAIRVFAAVAAVKTWMPDTRPGMTDSMRDAQNILRRS